MNKLRSTYTFAFSFLFGILNICLVSAQCPMITNSSFSGACTSAGSSCNICANESVTLSASEVNLPNGACIEWYYSSDPGFNPYNGNGTYIGCGSINAGSVSNVIFETTQDMCNGTYYVIGIINPADLQGCPGSYTNIFTFNVICPIATIGFLTPICSGFLGLTSSGGESYQWEGPGGFSSNLQNPILEFTDPAQGGLYYVTVTAANGCKTVKSVDVPPEVQMFVHIDPPYTDYIELCGGGSVTLTLIDYGGGTGSYINQGWYDNSGNFLSGAQSITVSAAGEYTYWVFDAIYGCGVGAFLDVHALDSLNISIDPHPIHLCPGGTIDISASSSNGLSPFEYLWSTGSSSSSININSIGSYVVTMTDAKGCSGTKQIDVPAGNPLTVSISPLSDVYCPGKNNYLTGKASGGLEPYEYDWVTPGGTASTAQINANMVGNYTVIITDKVGCSGTASINVKQNPDIVIDITPASPIICNNGTIKLNATASGGSGSGYQYKWTAPSGLTYTGKTITSIEAGVFKVIVTDSEGCTNEQKTTVTLVSELNVEIDPSPAEFCPGGFVVLDAYVVGGTGTYTFDWDTPSGSFTGNNIKADLLGVYYVTITDINGCTGKSEKEVKSKTEIQVSISPDSFSICKGDTIVLKASSTEPGILIYKWTGPEGAYTGDSIIVSSAGNYSVTVTDSGGCSGKSATVVKLNQNPGISISPVPALICEGDSLQLKVSSQDTNIITYNWQTLTGLKSGNTIYAKIASIYVVEVVNSLGCRAFDTIQTSLAPAITVDISPDPASFCAGNSIEITTSTSDTGIISYNWSTPQGILNTQSISAGIAGQYIATLINSFGCVGSDTINVVQNDTLPVSIVPVPASFCPGHNIKLTASTTAGGLINYNWSTPNGAQTGNEIIADVSGNYTVNITNSSGCSGTTSVNVTESQGLIVTIDPGNAGFCTGSSVDLTANATGSKLSYSWAIPGGGSSNNQTVNSSKPGSYSVTVTDEGGCTGTASVDVTEFAALEIVIDPDPASFCNNGSVVLTAINNNGVTPLTYEWASPVGSASSNTFDANTIGTYSVTVTDANGCSGTASTKVSQSTSLSLSFTPSDLGFCPGKSIDLTVKANGGQLPYGYSWNTPFGAVTTASFNTTTAGTYQVTVTDKNGCSGISDLEVKAFTDPVLDLPALLGFCPGNEVVIKANVTDSQTPISYYWTVPLGSSKLDSLIVSTPGDYNVTVTNGVGCTAISSTTVEKWDIPYIKYSPFPVEFCKGKSVEVTAGATIGLAPFSYYWQGPSATYTGTPLNISEAGIYYLTVTDSHSCTSSTSLTADESPGLTVSLNTDPDVLCGVTPFTIISKVNGGVSPYSYEWQTPSGIEINANLISYDFGDYTLTVKDVKGCKGTSVLSVKADSLSVVLDKTDPGCIALKAGSITLLSAANPSFPMQLVLNNNPPILIKSLPYLLNTLAAGTYHIDITGNNGCKQSINLELSEPSIPELKLGDDVTIFSGETYTIIPISNFIIDSIEWTNKSTLDCNPGCIEPIAKPTLNTTYKATAYSKDGCKAADDINIYVVEKESVYIPNSFSPNGDGFNDKWVVFTDQTVKQIKKIYVYDRWGESVFIQDNFPTNDPAYGWDGRFRGSYLNSSVLVYYVQVEFNDGRIKEFKGDVNLVR